ncbi:hypothetical protein T439DRAFT_346431 [Meredithblackwellia eburnea MCA 4105]
MFQDSKDYLDWIHIQEIARRQGAGSPRALVATLSTNLAILENELAERKKDSDRCFKTLSKIEEFVGFFEKFELEKKKVNKRAGQAMAITTRRKSGSSSQKLYVAISDEEESHTLPEQGPSQPKEMPSDKLQQTVSLATTASFQTLTSEIKRTILVFAVLQDVSFKDGNFLDDKLVTKIVGEEPYWWTHTFEALSLVNKEMNGLAASFTFKCLSAKSITNFFKLHIKRRHKLSFQTLDLTCGQLEQLRDSMDIIEDLPNVRKLTISSTHAIALTGRMGHADLRSDGELSQKEKFKREQLEMFRNAFKSFLVRCTSLVAVGVWDVYDLQWLIQCCPNLNFLEVSAQQISIDIEWAPIWTALCRLEDFHHLTLRSTEGNACFGNIVVGPLPGSLLNLGLGLTTLTLDRFDPAEICLKVLSATTENLQNLTITFIEDPTEWKQGVLSLHNFKSLRKLKVQNVTSTIILGLFDSTTDAPDFAELPPLRSLSITPSSIMEPILLPALLAKVRAAFQVALVLLAYTLEEIEIDSNEVLPWLGDSLETLANFSSRNCRLRLPNPEINWDRLEQNHNNIPASASQKKRGKETFGTIQLSVQRSLDFGQTWLKRIERDGWERVPRKELQQMLDAVELLEAHRKLSEY